MVFVGVCFREWRYGWGWFVYDTPGLLIWNVACSWSR